MEDIILLSILVVGLLTFCFFALRDQYKINKKVMYREKLMIKYLEYKVDEIEEKRARRSLGL